MYMTWVKALISERENRGADDDKLDDMMQSKGK